jgi:hypothetical protein
VTASAPDLRRVVALLADRALEGLDAGEQQELDGLLEAFPDLDAGVLDRTAAQVEVVLSRSASRLAAPVRRALLDDAEARFSPATAARSPRAERPRARVEPARAESAPPALQTAPAPALPWARIGLAAAAGALATLAVLWLVGLLSGSG